MEQEGTCTGMQVASESSKPQPVALMIKRCLHVFLWLRCERKCVILYDKNLDNAGRNQKQI